MGKARHDGDQQFALAIEGVNALFLEIDLSAVFLQLANGGKAVHSVSGKAADGFRDAQVDLSVSVPGVCCGDSFVRVHIHELPIRIRVDVLGVIIHLRLVGGELLFAVGGNTSIPSHLSSALGIERHFGMERL